MDDATRRFHSLLELVGQLGQVVEITKPALLELGAALVEIEALER
jgi:hypothetical protein